ncbi:carbohydrate ABC transporter permease [Halorarum salinum]|uniref:Sugar ABC transporter permease n=1 Tax=Halorarum salinum TaxID=2743089 RepID=A0A7D5LB66_9EURY|nr:sugar ABC transporter permease [Halobaculum salinum]QLG61915.1 sugar ABC transporter permease [Halobaculum salinum]
MASNLPTQRAAIQQRLSDVREFFDELLSNRKVMITFTVMPVLILFLLINIFPIVWAITASFFQVPPYGGTWEWIGIDQYIDLFALEAFRQSVWRSVVFASGSLLIQVTFGLGLALLVTQDFKFKRLIRAIAFLPYLVPMAVFGFIAIWMTNTRFGIINRILIDLGIVDSGIAFFSTEALVMPAIIIVSSWKFSIFVTIMAVARLQSIPDSHYEAAEMCGAGAWRKFRDVTLPNLRGVLFIVVLLRFVWMFNKFDIIWVLSHGGPNDVALTAPLFAYETAFQQLNIGGASAVATMLFGLLVVTAFLYFRVLEPSKGVRVE